MGSTNRTRWFILDGIQPVPWKIGTVGVIRRNGYSKGFLSPNEELVAFKNAVRETLEPMAVMTTGPVDVRIFIWRNMDNQEKKADATNMQKSIEDAMQGLVIENDRNVQSIRTTIVDQRIGARSAIIIGVSPAVNPFSYIPEEIMQQINLLDENAKVDHDTPVVEGTEDYF